jgi:cell division protein FtsW (lipid II flippase)
VADHEHEHPEHPEEAEAPWTEPEDDRSGLRDPDRAARSLAAMALSFEALALLLAIVPMRMILDDSGTAMVVILILVALCVVLAGMSRRSWVWPAGAVLQLAVIACWAIHWSLGVAGIVFGLVWAYCWYVKVALGRPPKR